MCGGGGNVLKSVSKAVSGIGKSIQNAVSGIGKAVSTIAKNPIFQALAPIALNFFVPGLGVALTGALGMSAAFAPMMMGAVTGGALGALGGGGLKSAAMGALLGGVTSGAADFAMTGNNPLSGMFSGAEGGVAANPLTAGGVGSTNLTGLGSGVGVDSSTLAGQFGAAPSASSGGFGLNPSASTGSFGQLTPPGGIGNASSLLKAPSDPGFLANLKSGEFLAAGKNLIPSSTLGKVALAGAGLAAFGGGGGQPEQESMPSGDPYGLDPSFKKRLEHQTFSYNPSAPIDLANYGVSNQVYNPRTRRYEASGVENPNMGEHRFVRPEFSTPTPATPVVAAGGGLMDSGRYQNPMYQDQMSQMGQMGQMSPLQAYAYAQGGMANMDETGVSDSIPALIDNRRPARLSSGEHVIPARVVSEIGEGSSEMGSRLLRNMSNRINALTKRTPIGRDSHARNLLPA